MRAVVLKEAFLEEENFLEIRGDEAFHLIRVVRVCVGEKILVLNGRGLKAYCLVEEVKNKLLKIKIERIEKVPSPRQIDLIFGVPKKEALEEIVRQSVELGYTHLFPVFSDYSQQGFHITDRLERLLESGLEQSNNAYQPVIEKSVSLKSFSFDQYSALFFYSSEQNYPPLKSHLFDLAGDKKVGIIIGPEGGWSPEELGFFSSQKNVYPIHLQCPILRTPTAAAVAMGQILTLLE